LLDAVESVIHAAASEEPAYLRDPAFAAELVEFVERLLLTT
jgi:hypothetical protein